MEYYLTKDEILEVIIEGIEDFVERAVEQQAEQAKIQITIQPGDVLIAMKKFTEKDKGNKLKITFN